MGEIKYSHRMMKIIEDDLTHADVHALIALHLNHMDDHSPQDSSYTLDLSGLQHDKITVWTIWQDDSLLGCAGLHELSPDWAEVKSMRTHPDHLRQGVAAAMMEHMLKVAKQRGYKKLSLETGTTPAFDPALKLYRKYGFANGDVFADYRESPYNQFLHLDL